MWCRPFIGAQVWNVEQKKVKVDAMASEQWHKVRNGMSRPLCYFLPLLIGHMKVACLALVRLPQLALHRSN